MKNTKFTLLLLFLTVSICSFAQIDTITVDSKNLKIEKIKPKINTYLVFIEKTDGTILDVSIWKRVISFSKLNNEKVIVIDQQWKNQEKIKTRVIKSIVSRKNFQPIYQYSENGKGVVEAYSFLKNRIVGTDSIQNNTKKDFSISNRNETLNWELDLETYQMLPYQLNTAFKINFYHPGSKNMLPKFYTYTVIGEQEIKTYNENSVDCWVLKIEHNLKSSATYWVDKKTGETIKMEEVFGEIKRSKIQISNLVN